MSGVYERVRFMNGDNAAVVYTVSELIDLLSELPENMRIMQGFGEGVRVQILKQASDGENTLEFEDDDF